MHFPKVLEKYKCTPNRLREIFTSKEAERLKEDPSDEDKSKHKADCQTYKIRKKFQERAWARILAGIQTNAENARVWQAVDMAWDAAPIQKDMIPLMLWATGKLTREQTMTAVTSGMDKAEIQKRFVKKVGEKETFNFDLPRICETNINIVRSYITRRLAAMDALWANLWPLFKYDPRGMSAVAQLRADVVTQKVDQMTDQYGYRRMGSQWRRDMLMYGKSVVFPRSAWDQKIGWRFKATNDGSEPSEVESYIDREGVDFVNPHPSRVFYDFNAPLGAINTDTGPSWIGYWDIVRWGSIADCEESYYNTKDVVNNDQWTGVVNSFPDFFGQYFDKCVMTFPDCRGKDPTHWNERCNSVGKYSAEQKDMGVMRAEYFEKINPKTEGIGDYDAEIWMRLVVGGAGTIIGAEFMPSIPACYGGININDNRMVSQSMASELLAIQDQMTNLVTNMLEQLRSSWVQLWLIDKDTLDEKIREDIIANAGNKTWWMEPKVLLYSSSKLKELGIMDPAQAFKVIQTQVRETVTQTITAMNQLLNLADRLLILSPNELGQPNPREVAAREVQEMSTSVQAIYSFINQGPREQIMAVKELLYESLITHGQPTVRVPVMRKYTLQTVKDAGFDVTDLDTEDLGNFVPLKTPIQGRLSEVVYDYYFDSREGSERALNTQGAQSLTQLIQMLTQVPGMAQKLGMDRMLDLVNATIRMSGAPIDLQIEKNDGEDDSIPDPSAQQPQQAPAPGQDPAIQQIGAHLMQEDKRLTTLEQTMQMLIQKLGVAGGQAPTAQPALPAPAAPSMTLA